MVQATNSDVTGLVLAGGRSTRFGDASENKAVATFEERTLLGRVVDAVAAATDRPPVVAVRTPDQRERYASVLSDRTVTFTLDDPAFDGPVAGVFGGTTAVDSSWVFCCGCDMPLLSPEGIRWLLEHRQDGRPARAALTLHHPDGTLEPLHTVYRRSAVEATRDRLSRSAGPRALLAALDPVRTISVDAAPAAIPLRESLTNVNTRTALAEASHQIASER